MDRFIIILSINAFISIRILFLQSFCNNILLAIRTVKGCSILLQHGTILSMTPVWAVEVPDRPAGLSELLEVLSNNHVDVEYMYSLFTHIEGKAYIVFRVAESDKFVSLLASHGITPSTSEELGIH